MHSRTNNAGKDGPPDEKNDAVVQADDVVRNAIENGSDYLVIGRPITQSDNPMNSLDSIIKEIS